MNDRYDVVVVGAGHAGVNLVAYLIKGGYSGTVALLNDEETLPYKRPPLSKGFLLGTESVDNIPLRTAEYWARSPVDLLRGMKVREVRPQERAVITAVGQSISYGRLVWAAGGRARRLPLPGADLRGVHRVRTLRDVTILKDELPLARRAVVIGGGYIGLETAAAFRKLGIEVTVVEAADRVLERVTSAVVSEYFHKVHNDAGVVIRVGAGFQEIVGHAGRVSSVVLDDGDVLPADIAVVGVGMEPNCEVLAAAGASCSNGVDVDEFCRTTLPGISAVGDCTSQLSAFVHGRRIRLESVQNANEQAKVVASDLLGSPVASREVPWFWSDQYDVKFKSAGLTGGHDRVVVRGDPGEGVFTVLYLSEGELIAIDCINNATEFAHGKALVKQRARLDALTLADHSQSLRDAMNAASQA
jgi:3-phenylpropionate/trans-cinnamate dioxygenase ferredoxin reductase component